MRIRDGARIVLSNPDMLHAGILPQHTRWAGFFANLRVVVLDEMHTYRGVFGSHVANVLRRLRRICRFYGADPQFILASATIANPGELAERLVEAPVTVIGPGQNGAPQGARDILLYNPPLVDPTLGIRRSSSLEATELAAHFLAHDVQTIVFAGARLTTELILTYLRDRPEPLPPVAGYRGGYLPAERREIERNLRSGKLRGVVATNALELGIDIGQLEAAVLAGYPGTIASAWQQMGRAGRRQGAAAALLVATPNPIDQYLMGHPEYLLDRSPEHALINPDNPVILAGHLACAAAELPFAADEGFGRAPDVAGALAFLAQAGELYTSGGRYFWAGQGYPEAATSLRSTSSERIIIQSQSALGSPQVIGEIDRAGATLLLYEGAIYIHSGDTYLVERLDWDANQAYVRPVQVDYYTRPSIGQDVQVIAEHGQAGVQGRTPETADRAHATPPGADPPRLRRGGRGSGLPNGKFRGHRPGLRNTASVQPNSEHPTPPGAESGQRDGEFVDHRPGLKDSATIQPNGEAQTQPGAESGLRNGELVDHRPGLKSAENGVLNGEVRDSRPGLRDLATKGASAELPASSVEYPASSIEQPESSLDAPTSDPHSPTPKAQVAWGDLRVVSRFTGFRTLTCDTNEVLSFTPLELPEQVLETEGCWLVLQPDLVEALRAEGAWLSSPNDYGPGWPAQRVAARARDGFRCQGCGAPELGDAAPGGRREHDVHHKIPLRAFVADPSLRPGLPAELAWQAANRLENLATLCPTCHHKAEATVRLHSGLGGLATLLGAVAPLYLMCDPHDLGVATEPQAPGTGLPTITIYEKIPAGIGYAPQLFALMPELLRAAHELVTRCPCEHGCPSCVGPVLDHAYAAGRQVPDASAPGAACVIYATMV